jgi:hypothetical protein
VTGSLAGGITDFNKRVIDFRLVKVNVLCMLMAGNGLRFAVIVRHSDD